MMTLDQFLLFLALMAVVWTATWWHIHSTTSAEKTLWLILAGAFMVAAGFSVLIYMPY